MGTDKASHLRAQHGPHGVDACGVRGGDLPKDMSAVDMTKLEAGGEGEDGPRLAQTAFMGGCTGGCMCDRSMTHSSQR